MRHAEEKKEHFVINREEEYDVNSLKNLNHLHDYSSANVKHLNIDELKELMKKLKWTL
jgi:hypothetical protein